MIPGLVLFLDGKCLDSGRTDNENLITVIVGNGYGRSAGCTLDF